MICRGTPARDSQRRVAISISPHSKAPIELYYKGKKVDGPISPSTDFHGYGDKIRREIAWRIPKKSRGKDLRVLDVGTGFGSTVTFLAAKLPKAGSKLWSIDPSGEVIENAKVEFAKNKNAQRISVEFVQADAAKLGFEDDFFDAAISVMVLHHIEDLARVFSELSRVLRPGGKLIIADYQPSAGKELEFQRRHEVSDFFRPEDVGRILKENGFAKVSVKPLKLWYLVEATKGSAKVA